MNRTVAAQRSGRFVVCVSGTITPRDEEWSKYADLIASTAADYPDGASAIRGFILTDGGVPTRSQRNLLSERVRGHKVTAALLSTSAAVRAAMFVMSIAQPSARCFGPAGLGAALSHIGATQAEYDELWRLARIGASHVGRSRVFEALPRPVQHATAGSVTAWTENRRER